MAKVLTSPNKNAFSPYAQQRAPVVLICGSVGRGKTTAIHPPGSKGLPPEETFIIQPIEKTLTIPSAREFYKLNHVSVCDWAGCVMSLRNSPDSIRYTVIDDLDYFLANEFMARIGEKGYDKWNDIASHTWSIFKTAAVLPGDQFVFINAHEDVYEEQRVMKTLGRLLRDKLEPEGLISIVLWAEVEILDPKTGKAEYFFRTQSDGRTNAKSPAGMFPYEIPNDFLAIANRIEEYYSGVPLSDSKIY